MIPTYPTPKSELQSPSNSSSSPKSKVPNKRNRESDSRTVFITGLTLKMKRKQLIDYFRSIYPSTINFTAKRLGSNKKTPGFGFLLLGREEEVRAALSRKTFYYNGKKLKAEPYLAEQDLQRHKDDVERRKVFVGKIPRTMKSHHLKRALETAIGPVESLNIVTNSSYKRKHRKGYGYVIFDSEASANQAVAMSTLYVDAYKAVLNLERAKEKNSEKKLNHNPKQNKTPKKIPYQEPTQKLTPRLPPSPAVTLPRKEMSQLLPALDNSYPNFQGEPEAVNQIIGIPRNKQDLTWNQGQLNPPKNMKNEPSEGSSFYNRPLRSQQQIVPNFFKDPKGRLEGVQNNRFSGGRGLPSRPNAWKKNKSTLKTPFLGKGPQASLRRLIIAQRGRGLANIGYTKIEDSITKNGWKEYCPAKLDHSAHNIRINYGRPSTKIYLN